MIKIWRLMAISAIFANACISGHISLAHATWPPPATTTAKGGENVVRPEELAFLRQDQTKLLRQSIQELEATLRDQQQESRM